MERGEIDRIIEKISPELKELAGFIHAHPELGQQEFQACIAQKALLEKYGFEVETGICGIETAYRAVCRTGKPGLKIAMVAEYDALPELGHGCGHNLIAMVSVGTGIALKELAEKYGGEIYVIGTPAEETKGAKVQMAAQGVFDGMDVAMMAHPLDEELECQNTLALKGFLIRFHGKPAHASSAPFEGINAMDAVINFYNMVNALRQQTRPDARIHGYIKKCGTASNTIPDYSETEILVRAEKISYVEELAEKVLNCARGAALGTGCTMEYEKADEDFMDTNSNLYLGELYAQQIDRLGIPIRRTRGKAVDASSDFGDVSYHCPAIQTGFDISGGAPLFAHTPEFAACAGTDAAMERGLDAVRAFYMTAEKLMSDPVHMKEIRKEFSLIAKK